MEKDRKIKKYSLVALVVALLGLTVVYATMTSTLKISGTARTNKSGINVVFEKIQGATISKSSRVLTTLDEPELIKSGRELNLGDITLSIPGDYYQYSINIVNKGKKTAKITGIQTPNMTDTALEYITPTFRYENGLDVGIDDTIAPGQYKKIIIRIVLKESITTEQYKAMPSDLELNLNAITITFEKVDSESGEPVIVSNPKVLAGTAMDGNDIYTSNTIKLFGENSPLTTQLIGGASGYKVTFLNTNEQYPETTNVFDGSQAQDGSVTISYVLDQNNYYNVYIGADGGVIAPSDSLYLFMAASEINNLNYLDTSNVTNMEGMFSGYQGSSLDLTSLNTSNVTNMRNMFAFSSPLTTLNLSSFNTSNVTDMVAMFEGDTHLTSLNLSSFNTGNVTDMSEMFDECNALEEIIFGNNFNTSNVTNMNLMFYACSSLETLNLSTFNTENVTNMYDMFGNCTSLESLDLSMFNTSKVTNFTFMFGDSTSLTSIDIRNVTFNSVADNSALNYAFNNVPANCLITVKDASIKTRLETVFPNLTNIQVAS